MNIKTLSDTSRIWIYQANPKFPVDKIPQLEIEIQHFIKDWTAHNYALTGFGTVYHNQFIVLMVDESRVGASGCSIDKSVHFIQKLERELKVTLLDRMTFAWKVGDEIKTGHRNEFSKLYAEGQINDETLVFDNLVKTKGEFEKNWLKPLGESWHKRMI